MVTAVRVGVRRARGPVQKRFEFLRRPLSEPQAEEYVRTVVQNLSLNEFVRTQELSWAQARSVIADIYGVRNREGDWYVKLYVHGGHLVVASCHRPEAPLLRADGLRIGRRQR
jgi:hypothetical protein